MCRWSVNQGLSTFMSRILLEAGQSLLDQSLQSLLIECPTSGGGFAVGYYDRPPVPELFSHLYAPTDSERVFLLALSDGLPEDTSARLAEMVRGVESAQTRAGIEAPFRCTSAVSDGEQTWALRYASHDDLRLLYYLVSRRRAVRRGRLQRDAAVIVASQPLLIVGAASSMRTPC